MHGTKADPTDRQELGNEVDPAGEADKAAVGATSGGDKAEPTSGEYKSDTTAGEYKPDPLMAGGDKPDAAAGGDKSEPLTAGGDKVVVGLATGEDKADRRGVLIGLAIVVAFFIALVVLFACSRTTDVVYIADAETPLSSGKPAADGADKDGKAGDRAADTGKDDVDGKGASSADGNDTAASEDSTDGTGAGSGSGPGGAGSGSGSSGDSGTGGSGSGSTGGSGGGGTTTPTDPNAGKTWHPAWDESVWVVDVPGHNDEVYHQEQGHYGSKCNICGADISGFAVQHLIDTEHDSYRTAWFTDAPAWFEQVWVPEVGHWTTIHHPGYWQ